VENVLSNQNNENLVINNNNNRPPSLSDCSQGDGKQGILLCWPNRIPCGCTDDIFCLFVSTGMTTSATRAASRLCPDHIVHNMYAKGFH